MRVCLLVAEEQLLVHGVQKQSRFLANGTLSINNFAIAIHDGAQGADKTILDLKVAANAFTGAIDTSAEVPFTRQVVLPSDAEERVSR